MTEWRRANPEKVALHRQHDKLRRDLPEVRAQLKAAQRRFYNGTRMRRQEELAGHSRPEPCELCGGVNSDGRAICFDHDHVTGAFQGWLCSNCNRMLGMVHDDPTLLRRLAVYLEEGGIRSLG